MNRPILVLASALALAVLALLPPAGHAQVTPSDILDNTSVLPIGSSTLPGSSNGGNGGTSGSPSANPSSSGGPTVPKNKCIGCLPPDSVRQLLRDQALKLNGGHERGGAGDVGQFGDEPTEPPPPTIPPLVVPGPPVGLIAFALVGVAVLVIRRRRA